MASNRARGRRTEVFVTIGSLKYGFRASSRTNSHRAILGHTLVTPTTTGVVFGANSPKPNRAQKDFGATGAVASYCDPGQEAALSTDGWSIIKTSRRRGVTKTPKVVTVFVGMPGGWNYAWTIGRGDLDLRTDLKFTEATGTEDNLVFGANSPKPPKASKKVNGQLVSSFIEPRASTIDGAIAAGYSVTGITGLLAEA